MTTPSSPASKPSRISTCLRRTFPSIWPTWNGGTGRPPRSKCCTVFETDPKILAGQGSGIEVMLAVGNIPASVPAAVLRASLRGQIRTVLSAPQLASAAQAMKVTVEEMQKDTDFKPYFNLKAVLVEEAGALRVAYFEFLPPSMLD